MLIRNLFVILVLGLISSCEGTGSPFTGDPTINRSIVDSLRYLPHDPANMTSSDRKYFADKAWIVVSQISPEFKVTGSDFYVDFNKQLAIAKYFIHTRIFADAVLEHAYVHTTEQAEIGFIDEGFNSSKYVPLDPKHDINPLEVLLVMRNLDYSVRVTKDFTRRSFTYSASLGERGIFRPKLPFTGWSPLNDGNYMIRHTINLHSLDRKITISLFLHEVTHNWGYNHGGFTTTANVGGGKYSSHADVPQAIQLILLRLLKKYESLYNSSYETKTIAHIYDVLNTATVTGKDDKGSDS